MIEVMYERPEGKEGMFSLKLKGHACYGGKGGDIVCAAASFMAQSLAFRLEDNEIRKIKTDLNSGNILIECCSLGETVEKKIRIEEIFEFAAAVLKVLSENFEKNLKFSKKVGPQG